MLVETLTEHLFDTFDTWVVIPTELTASASCCLREEYLRKVCHELLLRGRNSSSFLLCSRPSCLMKGTCRLASIKRSGSSCRFSQMTLGVTFPERTDFRLSWAIITEGNHVAVNLSVVHFFPCYVSTFAVQKFNEAKSSGRLVVEI
eukprot:GHVN01066193.1.p1 GENE.GHVN01066193.1~~GHVN01066193.1.p1  ORF type:complete len:146 (+),score=3.12 GHVN01066193.1:331-768(+)